MFSFWQSPANPRSNKFLALYLSFWLFRFPAGPRNPPLHLAAADKKEIKRLGNALAAKMADRDEAAVSEELELLDLLKKYKLVD